MTNRALLLLLASALAAHAAGFMADSTRGAGLFQTLACVQCHSINGTGGTTAPDLGRMVDRSFTPASLAATMWNHGPTMWGSMHEHQINPGALDEQAAQDLMAFFYAARFFEKPGDAGRGKHAFESRGCAKCHGLTAAVNPKAKPVSQWQVLDNPLALVAAMWNHRADMIAEAGVKGMAPPKLDPQDLTDILVYLRNLPENRSKEGVFHLDVTGTDQHVFESAGCAKCHQSEQTLADEIQGQTLTEIAVEMWNHAPRMAAEGAPPMPLAPGEMQALVSSLWAAKFFEDAGRPKQGAKVFEKNCAVCHADASSGVPQLPAAGQEFSGAAMVSALWRHGPPMLDRMKAKGLAWPHFDGTQMADLIAYLNSKHP
ncbi:MAG TPA: c-type cytochrome [Bryobacteraceae bacterium]|nr:c-type cytochrome [Bryobacteraceae bacterium]